jgi:pSer/pThr/pTyr-binding forkhead associated (FHA) protein
MPMFLVPLEEGEPIPLDKAILFIGRHPDCDVVLTNSRKVSRKHCCVAQINQGFVVRDLGSMNGVRVNDETTRDECKIKPGDELWVGDTGFRLEFRDAAAARKEAPAPQPAAKGNGSLRHATLDRKFISQDMPVAIPEEGADLIVEQTGKQKRPARPKTTERDIVELRDSDIIDDDDTEGSH